MSRAGDRDASIESFETGTMFDVMRIALNVLGALCLLSGCVWLLQGINVIPGSFMTGQTKWAIYGAITAIAGIGLLIAANRRRT